VKLAERYDIAIMSTKGMSNTAARELIDEMCGLHGIPALVLHDFDKSGMSILGTLKNDNRRYEFKYSPRIIDLGLRLADVVDLELESEDYDPGGNVDDNLRLNGATEEEIKFLRHRRVELNAFASDRFVSFIERKLDKNGIKKVVPDRDILARAYRLFVHSRRVEEIVGAELDKVSNDPVTVPKALEKRVRAMLAKHHEMRWDRAVREAADKNLGGDGDALLSLRGEVTRPAGLSGIRRPAGSGGGRIARRAPKVTARSSSRDLLPTGGRFPLRLVRPFGCPWHT
jgi:hypothetical protein